MANLYVTEFSSLGMVGNQIGQIGHQPYLATQKVAITAGVTYAAFFNPKTVMVRLHPDATCSVDFNVAAAATSPRMYQNSTEYFAVPAGGGTSVSVISNT